MAASWFPEYTPPSQETLTKAQSHHLHTLHKLLQRDYFQSMDWDYVLQDLARMAKEALDAQEAFVAIWDEPLRSWTVTTSQHKQLGEGEISSHGSRSILDRVRETQAPLLTDASAPLSLHSKSMLQHDVTGVLAVPLFFWERHHGQPQRRFLGCLSTHRTSSQPTFTQAEVELVQDIARLVQPILNVLQSMTSIQQTLQISQLQLEALRLDVAESYKLGSFVSNDPLFGKQVIEPLQRVADSQKINILLTGPTGSGKTHLARAFHYASARKQKPFIVLDCAQIASVTTLSAELFGYAPNSGYANAPPKGRPGKAQLADGGTLFVDEISTLPMELQQHLLRLIEEGTYSRLGSSEQHKTDIQVVVATNEDLPSLVAQRRFREDLYWRLTDLSLTLSPLTERLADLPAFAQRFLQKARERSPHSQIQRLTPEALSRLLQHPWDKAGNIRGLERSILRSVLLAPAGTQELDADHLVLPDTTVQDSSPLNPGPRQPVHSPATPSVPHDPQLEQIKQAIRTHRYATVAAEKLGISYRQLTWRLHKYGLKVRDVLQE